MRNVSGFRQPARLGFRRRLGLCDLTLGLGGLALPVTDLTLGPRVG